jgi:hypothetical protein
MSLTEIDVLLDHRNELAQIELNAIREQLTREAQRQIDADWEEWRKVAA